MSGGASRGASDKVSGGASSGLFSVASGRAVRCMSASLLGRWEGSMAVPFVAANGCMSASSLGQAGRQRRQHIYTRRSLVRLG